MPALRKLIATILLTLLAAALCAQQPSVSGRVDTVIDTVIRIDTVMVADTTDRYFQLAEKSLEFKKSTLDSLLTLVGIAVGVFGILAAVALWLMQRSREMSMEQSRRDQVSMEKVVKRTRVELARLLKSARKDAGNLSKLLYKTQEAASHRSEPVGGGGADEKGVGEDKTGDKPTSRESALWSDKINQISEADAEKAIDLYEQLRFSMSVEGVPADTLPSSLRRKMAENYYRLDRYEKGIEELVAYGAQSPQDYQAIHDWGVLLTRLYETTRERKWLEQAIEKHVQAVTINPDNYRLYFGLAWALDLMHSDTGDKKWADQAIQKYKKATALKPDFYQALANCSTILINLYHESQDVNLLDEALEQTNKVHEILPEYKGAYFNTACILALMEKKDEMLEALEKVILHDSKFKKIAREDEDFKKYWNDKDFIALVGKDIDEPQ